MQVSYTSFGHGQTNSTPVDFPICIEAVDTANWADYAAEYEKNLNGRLIRLALISLAIVGLGIWGFASIFSFFLG